MARDSARRALLTGLRRSFLTGLLVLMPAALTVYVLYRVFVWVDGFLRPLTARYPVIDIPGLGFVGVLVIVLLAGIAGGGIFGRTLLGWFEGGLERIPLVRSIYVSTKQMSEAFLKADRSFLKEVVLVQYPRAGMYVIGFVTSSWHLEEEGGAAHDFLMVFLPTTPNPMTGYLMMIPPGDAIPSDLSIEDAMKMVISGGAVVPWGHAGATAGPGGPASAAMGRTESV